MDGFFEILRTERQLTPRLPHCCLYVADPHGRYIPVTPMLRRVWLKGGRGSKWPDGKLMLFAVPGGFLDDPDYLTLRHNASAEQELRAEVRRLRATYRMGRGMSMPGIRSQMLPPRVRSPWS